MPEIKDFLAAWNLQIGVQEAKGYTITIRAKHMVIEKYKTYEFQIHIHFTRKTTSSNGNVSLAFETFKQEMEEKVKGTREVLSRYGNPYECYMDALKLKQKSLDLSFGDFIVIGHAKRIHRVNTR